MYFSEELFLKASDKISTNTHKIARLTWRKKLYPRK